MIFISVAQNWWKFLLLQYQAQGLSVNVRRVCEAGFRFIDSAQRGRNLRNTKMMKKEEII